MADYAPTAGIFQETIDVYPRLANMLGAYNFGSRREVLATTADQAESLWKILGFLFFFSDRRWVSQDYLLRQLCALDEKLARKSPGPKAAVVALKRNTLRILLGRLIRSGLIEKRLSKPEGVIIRITSQGLRVMKETSIGFSQNIIDCTTQISFDYSRSSLPTDKREKMEFLKRAYSLDDEELDSIISGIFVVIIRMYPQLANMMSLRMVGNSNEPLATTADQAKSFWKVIGFLYIVAKEGPVSQEELLDHLELIDRECYGVSIVALKRSTLRLLIGKLVRSGVIMKKSSGSGEMVIELTNYGKDVIEQTTRHIMQNVDHIVATIWANTRLATESHGKKYKADRLDETIVLSADRQKDALLQSWIGTPMGRTVVEPV